MPLPLEESLHVKSEAVSEDLKYDWRRFVIAKCKKEVQDIKLADGTEILKCWPNAGYFICLSNKAQKDIPQTLVTEVRKCKFQDL